MHLGSTADIATPVVSSAPERHGPRRWILELAVGIVALLTALATYLVLSGVAPVAPSPEAVTFLLIANIVLAVILVGAIVWRLYNLSQTRGSGVAGAQLHVRMVMVFAGISIVPTVMVALFSAVMLNLGIDSWFSERVRTAIDNAASLAQAYVAEQKYTMKQDVLALAKAIDDQFFIMSDSAKFRDYLDGQMRARKLSVVAIYDRDGNQIDGVRNTYLVDLGSPPSEEDFQQAAAGITVIPRDAGEDRVQALTQLRGGYYQQDRFLLAIRYVDSTVLQNQKQTIEAAQEYERLESNRTSVQLTFAAVYSVIGLLMLLAAVSLGLNAANRIVMPIGRLIGASERVSAGDLSARVETQGVDGELATLSSAFNRMTGELQSQQEALVETGRIAEDRRLFAEAVLSGVSAGVVGLDAWGRIDAANPSAEAFLGSAPGGLAQQSMEVVAPELNGLLAEARASEDGRASGQLDLARSGRTRNLSVRVTSERSDGRRTGFVMTFDDMTDLVAAERSAAWGDIARRIAHEIKNPLTPIQLSAERLRRKYSREIITDPEVFEQCTQTIIRQVGDIGRMVDEFSSFARMPTPTMRLEDAGELVRQAVFLQSVGNPAIDYKVEAPDGAVPLVCDGRLVAQALTNVLKNAAEAVSTKFGLDDSGEGTQKASGGAIKLRLTLEPQTATVTVMDNGIGLPQRDRDRLTEPYMTTRGKGTGLGLAIVKKIMEDHSGSLVLSDASETGGAQVALVFPLTNDMAAPPDGSNEQNSKLA
ncbi:Adaptive-response sensory-kinase SasA [Alphaproteobacteria bacterium SO-S41]|nr:Adaptive-response sensory-kinase SasA [Alphaproteobacteria bacterium SO-S41]